MQNMSNGNTTLLNQKFPILKDINKFHLSKSKIRPNFILHDSISYKSECALGGKTMIKYRRQSQIERDIKKQNEKIVDQLEEQKRHLTQHIIRQQFNKESNNFAPPVDFNAFIENQINGNSNNKQLTEASYNVFAATNENDNKEDKNQAEQNDKPIPYTQMQTNVQLPFLKKRYNTPPISKTRLTMRQLHSRNFSEAEKVVDKYTEDYHKPYNLASQYNITSLNNILLSQTDLNSSIQPTQTKQMTEQDHSICRSNANTASTMKSTQRIKRAVSEQGFKPYKKQTNYFPENEFYMYMKEVSQNRERNNVVENSISKILSTLKDESTQEPKKLQVQINGLVKKNRRSITEQKRVQFDEEGKPRFNKPVVQLTKLQELSKKTFSKDNIKLFIRKILFNLKDYLYIHENNDIPKHKLNHLGAERPKISQVIFSKSGFLRKDLTENDFLAMIYPKDFVRSEEEKRNAPSAESNFDLNTYFDFMYFNSRLQEYITKKNTKTLVKLENEIIKQTDVIEAKREEIIRDHQLKTVDKFRVRGQQQNIHSGLLKSEDNHSSFKDYNIKRQQYLMDYMNLIEKKLGNMELISQLTKNTYNQVTDVIKEVKKHSGDGS